MYSKLLASRHSAYIGVNGRSHWGPKGRELGIEALKGSNPVASAHLDFGEIAVPDATAFAATPLNFTVTTIDAGIADNTISASSNNGYLHIVPGSVAASGYNIQGLRANVTFRDTMQFTTSSTALAAGRDVYWGARMALSCTTAWDGAMFVGFASTDTGLMTPATGAFDAAAGSALGLHFGPTGVISLVKAISGTPTTLATLPQTATALAHTSTSFRARDFHDYFIWGHWVTTAGTTAVNWVEVYVDGKLAASAVNTTLPNHVTAFYSTIEVLNGAANTTTLGVTEILNGVTRNVAP